MKSTEFIKTISLVATLVKWHKTTRIFEVVNIGDVYLRDVTDASVLAEMWNPGDKSIFRVHLFPCTTKQVPFLLPVKFYDQGSLWGKVYVQVRSTGDLLCQFWEKSGAEREAKLCA